MATDLASSQTAADAVADKSTTPSSPATQNTGTDSSSVGVPLTKDEQTLVAQGDAQAPPGEASYTPPSGKTQGNDTEDSAGFAPAAPAPTKVGPIVGADILNLVQSINPNPLSAYASYTYNINLHVLTADDYHTMVNDPTNFVPSRNLISGANRYNATYNPTDPDNNYTSNSKTLRDPAFTDDFYFDELKMKTIIGLNAESGASNAIEINFTILEPYGMTLLDRILDINNTELDAANYLEMPYLLEINFFGVDDDGQLGLIPDTTKFIPIKIIGFKIKASVKGSEYSVQATPFNHQANFASAQDIKANFGVTAGTVGDFFASAPLTAEQQSAIDSAFSDTQRQAPNKGQDAGAPSDARVPSSASDANKNKAISLTSLTAAINAWNLKLVSDGNADYADKVTFVIDEAISDSSIIDPAKNTVDNTSPVTPQTNAASNAAQASAQVTPDPQTTYITTPATDNTGAYFGNPHIAAQGSRAGATGASQANATADPRSTLSADGGAAAAAAYAQSALASQGNPNAPDANVVDFGNSIFHLNAGTKILQIIDMVMMNSQYILSQLQDPSLKSKTQEEQNAAKESAAALAEATNAKEVKWYKVIPEIHLDKFDHARNVWGKTITYNIQSYTYHNNRHPDMPKTPPPPAVKNYQYLYTGQNTEVINFDIDFNALYFTALQANRGNTTDLNNTKDGEDGNICKPTYNPTQRIDVEKIGFKGGDAAATSLLGSTRAEVQAAHNVMQSFYTSAGGDMIQLKLQILGDPQFIKQDDIYYSPSAITKLNLRDEQFINGSLASDNGELYCTCTFKTPVDIDETTGLLRKDSKYYVSYFSGYYRVLSVDSEFRGGKFIQTLDLIRYPNQNNSGSPASAPSYDAERNDAAAVDAQYTANPAQPGGAQNIDLGNPALTPPQLPKATLPSTESDALAQVSGSGIQPTNWNAVIDPYEQIPGEDQTAGALDLKNIAQTGATIDIGSGTFPDGTAIIAAGAPG